ncbi:peptidase S1 [Vitreimonas sp.]|uniref:peptidase S1 n=1 Tax=Vitreimonas sp. TaxID=3069702 RepID=UPI002D77F492|nr:peptidase S1 [Vitreimonas sp.]
MNLPRTLAAAAAAIALSACATVPSGGLDYNANPNYGTVTLQGGFTPDPYNVNLRAGGDRSAEALSSSCRGMITNAPDVRLFFQPGSLPLIISVNSGSDTTLVVNGPDGSWYCDDDGGVNGLNPALRFNSPQSGRYEIWVGTYSSGSTQPATLSISEIYSN